MRENADQNNSECGCFLRSANVNVVYCWLSIFYVIVFAVVLVKKVCKSSKLNQPLISRIHDERMDISEIIVPQSFSAVLFLIILSFCFDLISHNFEKL